MIRRFEGHNARIQSVAFSPDGTMLASASSDYEYNADVQKEDVQLRLWDVASGRERCQLEGSNFNLSNLAFSPDARLLVALNCIGGQMYVWEIATGKRRRILGLKKWDPVACVLMLADSRTVAVGNSHEENGFLDLATGKVLGRFRGHYGAVNGLALSPDAKTLISGSSDTTSLVWDLASVLTPPRTVIEPVPPGGMEPLWTDLASADAAKADQAIWTLVRAGNEATDYLAGALGSGQR